MSVILALDQEQRITIPTIDLVALFSCNLQCYGCSIGSNFSISDEFTLEDKKVWIENLSQLFNKYKIHVGNFVLIGGEPFVSKHLLEMYNIVRSNFPESNYTIYSNGLLIHKNEAIVSKLDPETTSIRITVHRNDKEAIRQITAGLFLLKKYKIKFTMAGLEFPQFNKDPGYWWRVTHPLDNQGKIHPANESNYKRSWASCSFKDCFQLYDNAIWKCSRTAYIRHTLKRTNQLDDPEWQKYLKYKPLDIVNCTYDEIIDFFSAGPESVCSMCPAQIPYFKNKPTMRKDYDSFDPTNPSMIVGIPPEIK